MRILVTGTAGFIGGALARHLADKGETVLGFDVKPPKGLSGVEETIADLLDPEALRSTFRRFGPEAVVHLAARTDLAEKVSAHGYAANIDGVENLIGAIRDTPGVQRAIFTSSQLVCRVGYLPASATDDAPDTLYGESKVLTEKIVWERDGGGVVWCLVRPTTVWGPGMSPHYQRFLRMIARGRYFHIGRGALLKSYGYIGNVVHQFERLLTAPAELVHRKTLYLADDPPLSLRAWADAFQRAIEAPPIRTLPVGIARLLAKAGDTANRLGFADVPFSSFRLKNILTEYRFDLAETRRICGDPPCTMEEGVARMAAWYQDELA
jgi:nucleoside-diphosphate-sugar epimerase